MYLSRKTLFQSTSPGTSSSSVESVDFLRSICSEDSAGESRQGGRKESLLQMQSVLSRFRQWRLTWEARHSEAGSR